MLEALHGLFVSFSLTIGLGLALLGTLAFGYFGFGLISWAFFSFAMLWLLGIPKLLVFIISGTLLLFSIPFIRQFLFSRNVMLIFRKLKIMPQISETEKTALEAGTTWIDGELFSGKPNFQKILMETYPTIKEREKLFIETHVKKVCSMVSEYKAYQEGDLPKEVWDYLKKEKFFGMIIPESFGGLEFSAHGISEIISMLGSHSVPLAISVMVPNSLGPGELLAHYGTQAQKDHYLPRLANGTDIPCFALTEPEAGSDAGSIQSKGVIFKGEDGKLYVKLNWQKRYITLGAVSTLMGLAIKLEDPEEHLKRGKFLGITCILVPANLSGIMKNRRHDPLGVPFYNCPIEGKDVVVSIDQIIGGAEGAGSGWRMLMECLAAGRAISLPANSGGGVKRLTRLVSAYASVRKQFGISIAKFDGIVEALARIGGLTYLIEANRIFTTGAIDQGIKPAVVSAIMKYNTTELGRKVMMDSMDVLGGAAISRGPKNLIAAGYMALPIGITVEGANILTRTLIIFGQGAIRCHPYAYAQVKAMETNNISEFDKAFTGHMGHIITTACRAIVLSFTRGHWVKPPVQGPTARYFQLLTWASASFALLAEIAMAGMGGQLKFREKITGRFADILSWLYLITSVLRRFEAEGQPKEHLPFVHYGVRYGFCEMQKAFEGLLDNLEIPFISKLLKYPIAFWCRMNTFTSMPKDEIDRMIAQTLTTPGLLRDSLTPGVYIDPKVGDAFRDLEHAFKLNHSSEGIFKKMSIAMKKGELSKGKVHTKVEEAVSKKVITADEAELLKQTQLACRNAIDVDSFLLTEYGNGQVNI